MCCEPCGILVMYGVASNGWWPIGRGSGGERKHGSDNTRTIIFLVFLSHFLLTNLQLNPTLCTHGLLLRPGLCTCAYSNCMTMGFQSGSESGDYR